MAWMLAQMKVPYFLFEQRPVVVAAVIFEEEDDRRLREVNGVMIFGDPFYRYENLLKRSLRRFVLKWPQGERIHLQGSQCRSQNFRLEHSVMETTFYS